MTDQEKAEYAQKLLDLVGDDQFKRFVLLCVELLGTPELRRDIDRCAKAASATMHEFHKEVSEALLSAMAFNLSLGAFAEGEDRVAKMYARMFALLQYEREFFDLCVHHAAFAEMLAPACKREAEFIEAQLNELRAKTAQNQPIDRLDPTDKNRS